MSRYPAPRLPLGPLLEQAGASDHGHAAVILGCSRRNVLRFAREGIPCDAADELAIKIGLHPLTVWGAAWHDAEDEWVAKREEALAIHREREQRRRDEKAAWAFMDRRWRQWRDQQDRYDNDAIKRAESELGVGARGESREDVSYPSDEMAA